MMFRKRVERDWSGKLMPTDPIPGGPVNRNRGATGSGPPFVPEDLVHPICWRQFRPQKLCFQHELDDPIGFAVVRSARNSVGLLAIFKMRIRLAIHRTTP